MNLYKNGMSAMMVRVLYTVYTNPLDSIPSIEKKSQCTKNATARAIREMLGPDESYTRLRLLDHLGYIEIPEITDVTPEITDLRYKRIFNLIQSDPDISVAQIAYAMGYAKPSMNQMVSSFYRHFDYKREGVSTKLARLDFFRHMGWLDVERLKKDAYTQWVAWSALNRDNNYGTLAEN